MKTRLFLFIVLATAGSVAYFFLALRFVARWPWQISFYGLPVAACVLLGYLLGVWRKDSVATSAIAALACLIVPVAASASIMSFICMHERICP